MAGKESMHERFDREDVVRTSTDRAFGLVMAAALAIIGGIMLFGGSSIAFWWLVGSAGFLGFALVRPQALHPLNWLWTRFGLALHAVVSPLILGLIFFAVITPIGWGMRLASKDPLRLRRDPSATTYWLPRTPPGPSPESMRRQF
jgi:Saxitoxin biosynthesis operon protein SxtJ